MLHIKMFVSNAVQEIIQTNKNGEFPGRLQIKTTLDSRGPWRKTNPLGSQLLTAFSIGAKHCVVEMGIACQDLTNHRISQNYDIGF